MWIIKKIVLTICFICLVFVLAGCQGSKIKAEPFAERIATGGPHNEQTSVIGGRAVLEF